MADISTDDQESLFDESTPSATASAAQARIVAAGSLSQQPTTGSQKDTLKSDNLQAQDLDLPEKQPVSNNRSSAHFPESAFQKVLRQAKLETEQDFYHRDVKETDDGEVNAHLQRKKVELAELLAWKEDLRLLALTEFIPSPYYESWTKEANLFFRRLVIMKRRVENLKD